jgi:hypothetical protein
MIFGLTRSRAGVRMGKMDQFMNIRKKKEAKEVN